MPKWSVEEIECPSCGKKSEFKVWGSIDGAVNAKMKQEVLSEEMFTFKCPDCGNEAYTNYGFLYKDSAKKFLLAYGANEDNLEGFMRLSIERTRAEGHKTTDEELEGLKIYKKRVVETMNDMKEKILIADAGMDDRIIEIIKVIYLGRIQDANPDVSFDEIHFDSDAKGYHLVLLQKNQPIGAVDFTSELYELVSMEYEAELELPQSETVRIDMNWAAELMQGAEEE